DWFSKPYLGFKVDLTYLSRNLYPKRLNDFMLFCGDFRPLIEVSSFRRKFARNHLIHGIFQFWPGFTGLQFRQPNEKQSQPVQQNVRLNPILDPMVHRSKTECRYKSSRAISKSQTSRSSCFLSFSASFEL
ncbi:hypothetical protein, partial [Sporolactobacillus sp. THM19-2]|uniref:hypothetical protein n=1 Tax=Sporolactobacillus sp. THM19-2 TaxID=2511171 RepID=UPI0019826E31